MFIKNLLIVGYILFFLSCSGQNKNFDLIGKYQSVNKVTILNKFKRNTFYSKDVTLYLKIDSTFLEETCSSVSTGNWYKRNDSLILHVLHVELILGEKSNENYELKYLIKNGDLIRKSHEKGNKKVKLIDYLVKD